MIIGKSTKILFWTNHAKAKMFFYRLSESRVRRVLHSPKRIEEGVAPDTVAMMQEAGSKKHPYEIWVMVQDVKVGGRRKVISAWKYPGITRPSSDITKEFLRGQYMEFLEKEE